MKETMHAKPALDKSPQTGEKKASSPRTVCVLFPLPLKGGYDYLAPDGPALPAGTIVEAPFGKKPCVGVVLGEGSGDVPASKLRPLGALSPLPPLPPATIRFVSWVASYTVSAPGSILKMALGGKLMPSHPKDVWDAPDPNPDAPAAALTPEQATAAASLQDKITKGGFSATLLDGVTGSGKTEVYAEALAAALRRGEQVLLLLPEIAMTAALFARLARRFGAPPVLWHSELTPKQRRQTWNAVLNGQAKFIIGARSALFLPFPKLGLIVVDEEHEGSFKQEEGVIYHGRDMAVVRARLGEIPVILASATPSLETMNNVRKGKYDVVTLRERFGPAIMPKIGLIDLRREKMGSQQFISETLLTALNETIASGQQAMLFLNRRGYAPLTLCRACGHRLACPHCTSWLIEHKKTHRLHCHQCGYSLPLPKLCPTCGAEGKWAACGPGIERIAEEVAARLPGARTAVVASDTLSGPKEAEALIDQMEKGDLDLLIGTQIMAKGYHFPRLTLVGVIDGDLGLSGGDPRAAERTFQLLQQVAGRSGRAEDPGRVFLQTTAPDHPVMQALLKDDRDAFMHAEMTERAAYHLPPFARLASVTVSGADAALTLRAAQKLASLAPRIEGVRLLGPAPPPFAVLRGRARQRLLLRAPLGLPLSPLIQNWLAQLDLPRTLRVQVDIDPYSFL